jgi:glucokinase
VKGLVFGIGLDVGGTFTKIAAVSREGRLLALSQVPTEPGLGPKAFVSRAVDAVRALESGMSGKARSVGIGAAGEVDSRLGSLRFSPNMRPFKGFPLRDALSRALGRPAAMDNDANMAAWGAFVVELKRKVRNMAAITMGTGIGGGLVVEGRLFAGSTGSAGEFGHMRIVPGGESCSCGSRGCLEAYAGRRAIIETAERLLASGRRSLLRPLSGRLDPSDICEAADKGDAVGREVWSRVGNALGMGISNLILLLNPDVVVIAGGVARAGRHFLKPLREYLRWEPFRRPFIHARVRVARTDNLGALGAGLYSLEVSSRR